MSSFYHGKRKSNIYDPKSTKPFRLSRTKIDLFLNCQRCFYFDRRLGVSPPPGFPFTINSAIDELLKKEFDHYRKLQKPHPIMTENNIDAVPFDHPDMDKWRDALRRGIDFYHEPTRFQITGGIDDLWVKPNGELIILDYKATAKATEVSIDAPWQISYKRQLEVYQWLFRQNGFKVSPTAYIVYFNANVHAEEFNQHLDFKVSVLPHQGNDSWVEPTLNKAYECLQSDEVPDPHPDCDFCLYRKHIREVVTKHVKG